MKIALTMRVINSAGNTEARDAISHDMVSMIREWGHMPILLANDSLLLDEYFNGMEINGIILTGGNSLTPEFSGLPPADINDSSSLRDDFEKKLIAYAIRHNIPVLGICRGMHMINCFFGGKLVTTEPSLHVAKRHNIRILGDFWKGVLGESLDVNSFHNYGISEKTLAGELLPVAVSAESLIEAFCHRNSPIMGIMWHPERGDGATALCKDLLSKLLNLGRFWSL